MNQGKEIMWELSSTIKSKIRNFPELKKTLDYNNPKNPLILLEYYDFKSYTGVREKKSILFGNSNLVFIPKEKYGLEESFIVFDSAMFKKFKSDLFYYEVYLKLVEINLFHLFCTTKELDVNFLSDSTRILIHEIAVCIVKAAPSESFEQTYYKLERSNFNFLVAKPDSLKNFI